MLGLHANVAKNKTKQNKKQTNKQILLDNCTLLQMFGTYLHAVSLVWFLQPYER